MTRTSEIELSMYLDGELDEAATARIESALDADPQLMARFESLLRSDATLKAAFGPVLEAPLPPLVVMAQDSPAVARRAPLPQRTGVRMALAAGVAGLVLGFSVAQLSPLLATPENAAHVAAIEAQLPAVLEDEVSGTTVAFHDTLKGVSGTVTPVRTFRNEDGAFCRAYEARILDSDQSTSSLGIACRDEDGRWRTRLQVNDV